LEVYDLSGTGCTIVTAALFVEILTQGQLLMVDCKWRREQNAKTSEPRRRTEQYASNVPIPVPDGVGCWDFALQAAVDLASGSALAPNDLVPISIRNRRTAMTGRLGDSRDRFLKILRCGEFPHAAATAAFARAT
jgi:hypothetical protein